MTKLLSILDMPEGWNKEQIQALKSSVVWNGEDAVLEEKLLDLNRHLNRHAAATFVRAKIDEWKAVEAIATEIENLLSLQKQ